MRFYGNVVYVEQVEREDRPGVMVDKPTVRTVKGNVKKNFYRWKNNPNQSTLDAENVSHIIEIVADPYAINHFGSMRYIEWLGQKWKIESVDASSLPQLTIYVGGLYNG